MPSVKFLFSNQRRWLVNVQVLRDKKFIKKHYYRRFHADNFPKFLVLVVGKRGRNDGQVLGIQELVLLVPAENKECT
jgi:hypothetical protein